MAEPRTSSFTRLAYAIATIVLCLAAAEMGMRYKDWPRFVTSGWRVTATDGPLNQFGWRGQPGRQRRPGEFVVVLTGAGAVECQACPPTETMDVILETALRPYNPNVRVVTLGGNGYGQDQEYLALHEYFTHEHADLVVAWPSLADDVPANTFRSWQNPAGQKVVKPTFAWRGHDIQGPTEAIGDRIYKWKLSTLLWPMLIDLDRNWTILLPKADPGMAAPPDAIASRMHDAEPLDQQRSRWSIWLTPRPARVAYGIGLTRALFQHMRDLAVLNGARFAVLLTPTAADAQTTAPVAAEHNGHWYVADPAARDAAIAQITDGLNPVVLPPGDETLPSPQAERLVMARLAEALNQRDLLAHIQIARQRH